jgi:hypothetical protein
MDMANLSEKEAIQWKALQEEIYIQRRAYHPEGNLSPEDATTASDVANGN